MLHGLRCSLPVLLQVQISERLIKGDSVELADAQEMVQQAETFVDSMRQLVPPEAGGAFLR
jgi:hypothetical protein